MNNTKSYNPNLFIADTDSIKPVVRSTVDDMYSRNRDTERRERCFENILANLIDAHRSNSSIKINLNNNYFTKQQRYLPDHHTRSLFVKQINYLKENGLIEFTGGFYDKNKPSNSKTSTIKPSAAALDKLNLNLYEYKQVKPKELVILKDNNKLVIPYKDNSYTSLTRLELTKYNNLFNSTNISYPTITKTGKHWMVRIYNNSRFSLGGRYYTSHPYQRLSKEERSELLIDGLKVIEPDFSGLHVRLIYNLSKLESPDDPYDIQCDANRIVIKKCFLIAINSSDYETAIRAALYDDTIRSYNVSREHIELIFDTIRKEHRQIEKYFFSGAGLELQNIDSEITSRVLRHFTNKNILALPVHDSYIIAKEFESELIDVMKSSYKNIVGNFDPKVEL